jgi:cyclopropane fatty-acyl-phospholipid synthase-like methyltransferase
MIRTTAAFALLLLASAAAQAQTPHTHRHDFSGAEHWSKVFDDPARDAWQKPHEVITALKLAPDAIVADIGAGTGYFAVRLAHMTPKGRVFAVDIEPDMVRHLKERAQKSGLANLEPVQGAPDDPRLPEKVDRVLMVDTYHHIESRVDYFRRLRASLRPGGEVAIVDFTLESPVGPPKRARIPPQQVEDEMKRAGYAQVAQHGFLPNQYFLVFRPQ